MYFGMFVVVIIIARDFFLNIQSPPSPPRFLSVRYNLWPSSPLARHVTNSCLPPSLHLLILSGEWPKITRPGIPLDLSLQRAQVNKLNYFTGALDLFILMLLPRWRFLVPLGHCNWLARQMYATNDIEHKNVTATMGRGGKFSGRRLWINVEDSERNQVFVCQL